MVNSNPETVSTDYDTSDSLFFEPLTVEDVLEINRVMKPQGVIVQFGGQTPLNIRSNSNPATYRLSVPAPDINRPGKTVNYSKSSGTTQAASRPTVLHVIQEAVAIRSRRLPGCCSPKSYVLGGRAMKLSSPADLEYYMEHAVVGRW